MQAFSNVGGGASGSTYYAQHWSHASSADAHADVCLKNFAEGASHVNPTMDEGQEAWGWGLAGGGK